MHSASRFADPGAWVKNSDGSVSSSSTSRGAPSEPWITSTRA